jgi:hypothetical protein
MTNQERAEKTKEVELTTLQKICTLNARLTTETAQPVAIYWHHPFAMCFGETPHRVGYVWRIHATHVYFKIDDKIYSLPLTWLSESMLKDLWSAYKRECEETLPKERYKEVMKGLE